ncbi:13e12 repeat-containing protein [Mycobacterium triplex]|uniref:13e12 repeat-containing protein n=2 Tax=Mycobacterium triplex TaxID=47839 RepID=A0A024JVG4_9MYCO|nr:13e12 repeat-containing protein [Mycobacterium triplex]
MIECMFDGVGPGDLVAQIESSHRQESVLVARRLAAVAALLRQRVAAAGRGEDRRDYAVIDGFERTAAEVAAAMNLSPAAAGYLVSDAEALDTRLPRLAALLAEGRTDWRTVRLILARTELITEDRLIAEVDRSLATRIATWRGWSRQRIVNAVDAAVRAVDPEAARRRRETADTDRYIAVAPLSNGMAEIYGTVGAPAAKAFDRRLSQLAGQVCAGDPRTTDQRRADALAALAQGRALACRCQQPDCPATPAADHAPDAGGVRVVVNVIADQHTVYAGSDAPGYLEGYGVIDAEQVRQLADAATHRSVDPVVSATEALRYQPPAALERFVRCRDLTCRFPGCSRPAEVCDLDHTIAFNHHNPAAGGPTTAGNLKCLCRLHHRLKTFGGWRDTQLPDGTVIWTSPAGRTYRTHPAGTDLFPPPPRPACTAPTPTRHDRTTQRRARITRARAHNRRQQARNEEIAARKFRNHMRDSLFAFKGTPSTSPFCTWVNQPHEPEQLPPDWTPDPPTPLPDDPPF